MTLATFIIDNAEQIISEWEGAAMPDSGERSAVLQRDQVSQLLFAIAGDIDNTHDVPAYERNMATTIAARSLMHELPGMDLPYISEGIRILRESVIRLWLARGLSGAPDAVTDICRFNEAVDRVLSESIAHTTLQAERTRAMFLAMLGHDLRTPISAVDMACQYLARTDVPAERKLEAIARISRCTGTMDAMIRDLLDFARARLGKSMTIAAKAAAIAPICLVAVEDARNAHPYREFRFDEHGALSWPVDSDRLRQCLLKLLNNAAQNSIKGTPVMLATHAKDDVLVLRVQHHGQAIPADTMQALFDPLAQLARADAGPDCGPPPKLGLDLFIAQEIARAHGGDIAVTSSGMDTEFVVSLPRPEGRHGKKA